ncbi:MAG: ATP-binding protein [Candidatus Margulisiibacteriota bacterium]
MFKNRYLAPYIVDDLKEKMVFLGGPRQVGKTTLAKDVISGCFAHALYFNWDKRENQRQILSGVWPAGTDLIILDELHKYPKWKSFIKGEYDTRKSGMAFLVTGSARLDTYRKGGDSLQGRYHYYRLHPFSLAELHASKPTQMAGAALEFGSSFHPVTLKELLQFGGFPEPLLRQNENTLRRWQNERVERMCQEDIRDLEPLRDIGNFRLLTTLLPDRVGSLLSLNSMREDLQVTHRSVSHWMDILEAFYYQFRIYPFTSHTIRSLKKEPKLYLWDWSEISGTGARFENLVASHLLKYVHFLKDQEGYKADLHFVRDADKREVDFLVTLSGKPWFLCEVKSENTGISQSLMYFKQRLNVPFAYQVVSKEHVDMENQDVRVISASKFLTALI